MDKVVHFEIPANDPKKANEFYSKVFGWKIEAVPDMSYWIARTVDVDEKMMPKESGAINGGIYKRNEHSAKNPVIVINVDSIDQKIKSIQKAGGKVIMEKINVGNFGFYAQFKDTEGNVLGIWENIKK